MSALSVGVSCSSQSSGDLDGETLGVAQSLRGALSDTALRRRLDDSWDGGLKQHEAIQSLYPKSLENMAELRRIIVSDSQPTDVKVLAVRVAQCVPIAAYLDLLRFLDTEFAAGNVTDAVVVAALLPGEGWGSALADAYEDPNVRTALETLEAGRHSEAVRKASDTILSGDASRFLQHLRDTRSTPPILSCDEST